MTRTSRPIALGLFVTAGATLVLAGVLSTGGTARADGTCTLYWTGATSSAWNTAGNWSGSDGGTTAGRTPTSTDVVCMSSAPARATVVYPSQSKTLAGLNFANSATSLEIQGGTLTVTTNAGTIANLTFDAGTLAGSAPMTLTGTLSFPGSQVTFTGATKTIAAGAALTTSATVVVGGTTAGQSGALANAGSVTLVGTAIDVATGPSGGTGSTFTNSGALTLRNGSVLDVTGSGPKAPAATNSGSLTVSGNANSAITIPFTNTGTVTTTNAALTVTAGNVATTTDTGSWVTGDQPDGITFASGSRSLTAGSVTGTAGLVVTNSAVVAFSAGVTISNLEQDSGTISGTVSVGNAVLNGGTLTGGGTMTLTGGSSQVCSPTVDNGYTLTNTGTATTALISCAPYLSRGGHLVNTGTWTVTGGGANSGTWYFVADDGNTANSVLNDTGASLTVNLAGNTLTAAVSPRFTDNGTLTLTKGSLRLDAGNIAGTTDTGTVSLAQGTTLVLNGGSRTISTTTVSGAGLLDLTGGTLTFTGSPTIANLQQDGGTIAGDVTVTTGTLNGGTLTGTGTMTLTGTATQLCSPTVDNGYTLTNTGTATTALISCAPYLSRGGHLVNTGTWTVTGGGANTGAWYVVGDDGATGNSVLNGSGATLTVGLAGNGLTAAVSPRFTNNGTVALAKGSLRLDAGNIAGTTDTGTSSLAQGTTLLLQGGSRTINTTTVTGAGLLDVAGGAVTFTGSPTITNLQQDGGTITGNVTVTTGTLNGGTLTGTGTMTLTGTGSQVCNPTVDNGYTLTNTGTATTALITCEPYLTRGGHLVNTGTWTVSGGGSSTGTWYFVGDDGATGNSVLNDTGATLTVTLASNNLTGILGTTFTDRGTVTVIKGALQVPTLTNLSGAGVLTDGTWTVTAGKLVVPTAITTNAATVTVGASGSVTTSGGGNALASLATNTGTLTITPSLTITGPLTNSGSLTVAGGTLQPSRYTQTAGTTTVAAGAKLRAGSAGTAAVLLTGGTMTGSGTVLGAVSGPATVAPGTNGVGTMTITGSYAAQGASTFSPTVGATSGVATVSGAITLAGTLALTTAGPIPAIGTSVTVLDGASRSGQFTTVTGQDVPGSGAYWVVSYTATGVVVTLTADPTVSIAGSTVAEGNSDTSNATFAVSLSSPSQVPVTVAFSTADGTATAGSDYTATSGTVLFPVGSTSQTVSVPVTGDTVYENDETFTVTLAAPSGATLGTATATGTIVNDDAAPVVSIGSAGGSVDKNLGTTIVFPVSLSAASALDVQVTYATSDGTATAPNDYTSTSGTLVIPAGSTTATITVAVPAQPGASAPKTFTVTLTSPVNATLGTATATGTITNTNTAGGTPAVTSVSPNLGAQGATVDVTIAGANLEAGSTVSVAGGGVSVSNVVYQNSAQLTGRFTIAGSATPGARDVVVTGPTAGPATCSGCFTVTARPTVGTPSVTAFAQGNVDVLVGVTGSNFGPGTTLSFVKGTKTITADSVVVNSATSLTVTIAVATSATTGAYDVVVANPDGGTGTCTGCVKVFAAPKLKSVTPSALTRGTPTTVTVTGTGFVAGAVLTVQDCTLSNVTVVNATTITASVTPRANAATGTKAVKVFNPASAGSGTASAKLVTVS